MEQIEGRCQCSPDCPKLAGHNWKYAYGHKPGRSTAALARHNRLRSTRPTHDAADKTLASLRRDQAAIVKEIERLDDEVERYRKAIDIGLDAKDRMVEQHLMVTATIEGLEMLRPQQTATVH